MRSAGEVVPDAPPTSAAVLAMLPDGETKRSFLLDCTGCHQMDASRAFPDGRARTRDEWATIVARMLGFAGARSSFPVIGADRDPAATADWLARHWTSPPAGSPDYRAVVPADVQEFPFPQPQDLPHDLAVHPDGGIVVTGMFTHRMYLLDPSLGTWSDVAIPVQGANPRALDLDAAGDWWVLLGGPGKAARYRVDDGEWDVWDIGMYGHSIRPDRRGRAWFNGHFSKDPVQLGYVDAASGEVRLFDVPGPAPLADGGGPIPYGLRVAPDGSVWMTELAGNRLIRLEPETGRFDIHALPSTVSGPRRPDVAADGTVWIPEYSGGGVAAFEPATGRFRRHELPYPDALPYVAVVDDARGRVWIGTGAADALFMIDTASGRVSTVPLPTRGALVRHLDVEPATGAVWAAYGASPGIPSRIARVQLR